MNARRTLLELFDAALRAVDGRTRVARTLRAMSFPRPLFVFAVGKAASAMTLGAFDALGDTLRGALVITKDGHVDAQLTAHPRVTVIESAHPVPDARSLAAGERFVAQLEALDDSTMPLFLVSGGASSLVERLRSGASLEQLRALNARGLAAGWPIGELNVARTGLSQIKGGGVARLLGSRAACALFLSDVPGDDPDVIGSGLLGHDAGRADGIERRVVAASADAVRAVVQAGAVRGLRIDAPSGRFDGNCEDVASSFVRDLRATPGDGLVWSGETTVELPDTPGRGGRNTHLALLAARMIERSTMTILAAGTDGSDGPTEDAGALVDGGTVRRIEISGADVERTVVAADSATALAGAGDLLHTGPTGTNVGDILIGLKYSPARSVVIPQHA